MKIIKIFALLLIFQSVSFSQSGWIQQNSGTNNRLFTCCFLNDLTGYVGGEKGTILKTTNGGNNWSSVYNGYNYNVVALTFINSTTGWVYLKNENKADSTFILKTVSGGLIWNKYFLDTNFTIWDWGQFQFMNANTGYLAGYMDLKKTTNGGLNWYVIHDEPSMRVFFINELTGWIAGGSQGIRKTTNGGLNWVQQQPGYQNNNGADFHFFDSQKGFAIPKSFGNAGYLHSTTNGGINWHLHAEFNGDSYRSIQFVNAGTGYMLAYDHNTNDHKLAKTTNAGVNWIIHNINNTHFAYKVFFSSVNTGWIVGDSGKIFKSTNGGTTIGIDPISTIIPNDFSLSQNYPNPFNPSTKIRFDIPNNVSDNIQLSVFDLLGKEVSALVNEELRPGTYEVDFDASNLPSGVYYYKLTAGNYTQTKKMVLLK